MNKQNILFIYSSKDKFQESVASSTKQYIKDNLSDYIIFEILNIDKVNLEKYIKTYNDIYNKVYIYEECSKNIKEILNQYNNFELVKYNKDNSCVFKSNGYDGYCKHTFNNHGLLLEKELEDNIGTFIKYRFNLYEGITKCEFTLSKYNKISKEEKKNYYNDINECFEQNKLDIENKINYYTGQLNSYKNYLARLNKTYSNLIKK